MLRGLIVGGPDGKRRRCTQIAVCQGNDQELKSRGARFGAKKNHNVYRKGIRYGTVLYFKLCIFSSGISLYKTDTPVKTQAPSL